MTQSRKWSLLATVVIAALLAAGWFLLITPKRSEAADLRAQDEAAQSANQQLRAKLQQLKALAPQLPKREAEFATIRRQIPDNPALPDLIRQLTSAARKSGAELKSLAPATPVAVAAPTTVADPTAAPAADQLMQVPLTVTIAGTYSEAEDYVDRLEGMRRLLMVTGFTMAADDEADEASGNVKVSLTGRVYMVNPAAAATAVGATPSATGTTSTEAPAAADTSAN